MFEILEKISQEYDNEEKINARIKFEALCSISNDLCKKCSQNYFVFYLISKSIKRVKRKISTLY